MPKQSHVINVDGEYNFPRGFTISDNRIEDMLQRHLSPGEYVVWRQYLRFWGSNKKKAYPSLAYLSNVTGMSEKTIRKCNKELSRKKFLTYISGGPGRSNLYTYKPIQKIIKYYYGSEDAKNVVVEEHTVAIREVEPDSKKVNEVFDKLTDKESVFVNAFRCEFVKGYEERYSYAYELDEKDAKTLVGKANELIDIEKYTNLIKTFFTTKNSYIDKSDRSIYFFFRPTVIKSMVSEYNSTDKGRWEAQAEKMWNDIRWTLQDDALGKPEYKDIEKWIRERIKLGGANKKRDEHVVAILVKRVREYLESTQ